MRYLLLACVALPLACGCGAEPTDPSGPGAPNVLLYTIDTLRADHLGVYGYEKKTSPRIDAFARDAVVFDNAYAPSAWTRPSVASLLTGLEPTSHDVRTRIDRVEPPVTLLSEVLSAAGYHTAAIVTNPNIVSFWGFDQGFDRFDDVEAAHGVAQPDADAVTDRVLEYISDPAQRPFFVYAHVLDPHGPYDPPAPYARRFGGGPGEILKPSTMTRATPAATFRNQVARYDGEIAFTDAEFGRLLDGLIERDLYRDAMIVVTADHGEELLEHGAGGHGHTLYQELVHVPLIIKLPGNVNAGTRVDARVGLIDVAPTILAHLDDDSTAAPSMDGTDVTPGAPATGQARDRVLFMDLDQERFDGTRNVAQGVLAGPYKYIRVASPIEDEMLFDLAGDPGEHTNLCSTETEIARRLQHALADHVPAHAPAPARTAVLSVVNRGGAQERRIEGRLTTTGRFVDLRTSAGEAGDQVEAADGGRTLTFRVVLRNEPHPFGGRPKWIVDADEITFGLDPPDAPIVVERLTAGGGGQDGPGDSDGTIGLFLGAERRRAEGIPVTLRLTDPSLRVPDAGFMFRENGKRIRRPPPGAYLGVVAVRDGARTVDGVSPQLQQRLQALGYVP